MPPELDDYAGFDVKAAAADIGGDLFPSQEQAGADQNTPTAATESDLQSPAVPAPVVETPAVDPNAPAPRVEPGQNSEVLALPKSWKKDTAPLWEKADPLLKKYVYEREANVMRGIQQYQQGYQSWDQLVSPFAPLFQQNPDVNPVQLMQGLMNTHLQLLNPNAPAEKKIELVQALLNEYGINLTGQQQTPVDQRLMADVQALRQELSNIKSQQTRSQQALYDEGVKTQMRAVDAFSSDPKNKYFEEVGNDIIRFLQNGTAADLPSAYDLACWANPVVRAKMLAEQQAPAQIDKPRKPNGQFVNLDDTPPPARKAKVGTIDSTIDSIVAQHYQKH